MAWIAIITDRDEEVARFEIKPEVTRGEMVWGDTLERQVPGIVAAVEEAIRKDDR